MTRDIHLSATVANFHLRRRLEAAQFVEDQFSDCRRCTAANYHSTYRGPQGGAIDHVWESITNELSESKDFVGSLEMERLVQEDHLPLCTISINGSAPPLDIQQCPAGVFKACDVHIGVRTDGQHGSCEGFLEGIGLASFQKHRRNEPWRIFTATFDDMAAGEIFYRVVRAIMPTCDGTTMKFKLETTIASLRQPAHAPVLPLTYREQLKNWVAKLPDAAHGLASSPFSRAPEEYVSNLG